MAPNNALSFGKARHAQILTAVAATALLGSSALAAPHKLLVISIDGLDWRYLRDRDALGMKIPNLRRLLATSQVAMASPACGPRHLALAHQHDDRRAAGPARYPAECRRAAGLSLSYWSAAKIKVPTLWQCMVKAGRTVGAVNWPVTATANITWNLPEIYAKRNGDSSDLETVDKYGTPGLVAEITRARPSFGYRWLDDRTRTIGTEYILKAKQPDLMLVHLAESDSEQHEEGPYTPNAMAVLERSDELIGDILKATPKGYDVALVSDHGFEAIDHVANLKVMASGDGVTGDMIITNGLVTTTDAKVAAWLRAKGGDIGREVPHAEAAAIFPAAGHRRRRLRTRAACAVWKRRDRSCARQIQHRGTHGFWPKRSDYHSVFLLSGPGIKPGKLGTIEMVSLQPFCGRSGRELRALEARPPGSHPRRHPRHGRGRPG